MKNRFIFLGIILALVSCSSTKPVASNGSSGDARKSSSPQFINDVSISPGSSRSAGSDKTDHAVYRSGEGHARSSSMERYSMLQFKYAILENASVEDMTNTRLLEFMDEWYGAQYHYGGTTKDGIDCSAFVSMLMSTVFDVTNLPRVSRDQYEQSRHLKKDELREGDLVFFHTSGKHRTVTHVGVYLRNNKFVHASISGVMISDMQSGYYADHYVGGGRVMQD